MGVRAFLKASSSMALLLVTARSATTQPSPSKKYNERFVPDPRRGLFGDGRPGTHGEEPDGDVVGRIRSPGIRRRFLALGTHELARPLGTALVPPSGLVADSTLGARA